MKTWNVGVVGCGKIARAYFEGMAQFPRLRVTACADLDPARASEAAETFGIAQALTVDELVASSDIDIAVNLTIPAAHAEVDCRLLAAGHHVYSEKPFALTLAEGRAISAAAAEAGRRIGCAPDTVLGAGVQTAREVLDAGRIGVPVGFTAVMQGGGHEHWHPSPAFYYQKGGGPVFDMGPYYLHALITLLGPVRRVSGLTRTTHAQRTITSEPLRGQIVDVEVPTHVVSVLEFQQGTIGTMTMSFDVPGKFTNPIIEVFGTEGTLKVPDPNGMGGTVEIGGIRATEWEPVPVTRPYAQSCRGLGVADLAAAIAENRPHRANDQIALHALEIMEAVHVSATEGRHITLTTTCERPAAMRGDRAEFSE